MSQQEINLEMYSSSGEALSLLARSMATGRVEQFLLDLANLRETDAASVARFQERYSEFLFPVPEERKVGVAFKSSQSGIYGVKGFPRFIFNLQFLLRRAWERPTPLDRETHLSQTLLKVHEQFLRVTERKRAGGMEYDAIWQAFGRIVIGLTHAQRVSDRMRRCENSSCPAPYFVARKRTQKYCSEECAAPAQREQKKAWWNEHGEEWRKEHGKKSKTGKAQR